MQWAFAYKALTVPQQRRLANCALQSQRVIPAPVSFHTMASEFSKLGAFYSLAHPTSFSSHSPSVGGEERCDGIEMVDLTGDSDVEDDKIGIHRHDDGTEVAGLPASSITMDGMRNEAEGMEKGAAEVGVASQDLTKDLDSDDEVRTGLIGGEDTPNSDVDLLLHTGLGSNSYYPFAVGRGGASARFGHRPLGERVS